MGGKYTKDTAEKLPASQNNLKIKQAHCTQYAEELHI